MLRRLCACTVLLMLYSCTGIDVNTYHNNNPKLVLENFFNGHLTAHGVVKNRRGKVIRLFNATIDANWEKETGILDETFKFDDGEIQKRMWILTKQSDNYYTGTAKDVAGTAHLKLSGNSLFIKYVLSVPYKGKTINVNVDDRMYLINDNVLINETKMSKFGFQVGSVALTIVK